MHKQFVVSLFLLLTVPALADQIILKNGDKLTGSIVKSDGKELVIRTDYAGDITVKFDAIQSLTSAGDLNVTLGGKTAVGPVSTNGDNVVVTTKTAGPVEASITSVTLLRSPAEEAAYQKSLHPGLMEGWNGGLNLGFAVTRGNSETKNLAIGFNAVRKGFHDKLTLYTNSIYATNDLPTASPHTTANTIGGGALYTHDLNPRVFGFVNGDFFSNSLQHLDLRSSFGGGAGMHVIKSSATAFDLLAGVNYTHESYSDVLNPHADPTLCLTGTEPACFYSPAYTSATLNVGDTFTHKVGKSTDITQALSFYQGITNTRIAEPAGLFKDVQAYRGTFNFGTVTKLSKWLGWQNSFGDVYVSDPPAGTKKNDLQLSTGVSFTFTH